MAERAVNSVTSAITGELTSRVFSGLLQRYGMRSATHEKLQQLEILLIKIHSAVEASEKRTTENSWLLRWRDKLKEAAKQGDEVLASFQQRVKDTQTTSNTDGNQQQGEEAASSSAASPFTAVTAVSFTRNSLSSMVQGICSAREMLFSSGNDDIESLNKAVGRLEKLSLDIGKFIKLHHLEALPKLDQASCSTALSTKVHGPMTNVKKRRGKKRCRCSIEYSDPSPGLSLFSLPPSKEELMEQMSSQIGSSCLIQKYIDNEPEPAHLFDFESGLVVFPKEQQFMLLQDRLEAAFGEICKAVELANSRDLKDLEWLAYWAGILRFAKELGRDVLDTTSSCKTANAEDSKESAVECDQDKDELHTFALRLEGLARDAEYFCKLVYMCPAC